MFELIGLGLKLIKWLFTSLIGTLLLALGGSLFVCTGCVGVATVEDESAPTKVSIADVEAKGVPAKKWLQITDGYVFFPMHVWRYTRQVEKSTTPGTATEKVLKEDIEMHYLPLVSKEVADQWLKDFDAQALQGERPVLDFSKCKVMLKIKPKDFEVAFPGVSSGVDASKPSQQVNVTGEAGLVSAENADVLKSLGDGTRNADFKQMTLLEWGGEPASKGSMACVSVFGLLWFIPVVVCLVRRFVGGKGSPAVPVSASRQGHYEEHGITFDYPPDWSVKTVPLGQTRDCWSIDVSPSGHGSVFVQVYGMPMPDALDTTAEALKKSPAYAGATFTKSGGILAGQPAKGYDTRGVVLGKERVGQIHAAVVGRRTVLLTWNAAEEDRPQLAAGLAMIRNSLKV